MKVTKTAFPNGDIFYKNERGEFHHEDGPAVIYTNGYQAWFINGKLHCEDEPAVIYPDGSKVYYLHGYHYYYEEWLELIPNPIRYKWREYCKQYN